MKNIKFSIILFLVAYMFLCGNAFAIEYKVIKLKQVDNMMLIGFLVIDGGRKFIIDKMISLNETYSSNDYINAARELISDEVEVWRNSIYSEPFILTFDQQKKQKIKQLYKNIKSFINTLPDGIPRYDADLKMNLMNAAMSAIAAGQSKPAAVTSAENWLMTVQGVFIAKKAAIAAAEDQSALDAIDVSVETLESQYGRDGTVLQDPAISTSDLVNP